MSVHPNPPVRSPFSFENSIAENNNAASPLKVEARDKYRVLIVEDDIPASRLIAANLHKAGLEFHCVGNGELALRSFEEDPPHLVLLDLMLPDTNGFEICRKIRAQSQVPVIMMTARVETTYQMRSFRLGADDYVLKPFDPQLLVARIIAHLRRVYRYEYSAPQPPREKTSRANIPQVLPTAEVRPEQSTSQIPDGWAGCGACSYMGPLEKFPRRYNGHGQNVLTCPHCGVERMVQFVVN